MNRDVDYTDKLFQTYPDILTPEQLQKMLGIGRNKVYKLLKNKAIYSKRIGNNYIIPKISLIQYLMEK